jgi:hypothetical protein
MTAHMYSMRIIDHCYSNMNCTVNNRSIHNAITCIHILSSKTSLSREISSARQPFFSVRCNYHDSRPRRSQRDRMMRAVMPSHEMLSPQEETRPEENHSLEFFVTCYPGLERVSILFTPLSFVLQTSSFISLCA